jgi:hypothetical protein
MKGNSSIRFELTSLLKCLKMQRFYRNSSMTNLFVTSFPNKPVFSVTYETRQFVPYGGRCVTSLFSSHASPRGHRSRRVTGARPIAEWDVFDEKRDKTRQRTRRGGYVRLVTISPKQRDTGHQPSR